MKVHDSEDSFQSEVLKEFRALGWYAVHLSPPTVPGWQDVLALKSPYGLVLELKDFTEADLDKPVKKLFTPAQLPRYIEQLRSHIGGIDLAFYDRTEVTGEFRYHLHHFNSVDQVAQRMNLGLDVFNMSHGIQFITCAGMVKFITQSTEGTHPF